MARMPEARWQGEHGSTKSKMTKYDIVCIHTIVGYAPAHAAHFSTDNAGTIYQSRDTAYKSAANLEGNHRVISIENADMPPKWNTGDGRAVPDFTPAQIEAIAKIIVWAHKTHGIPIVACPDSRPGSRGIAYHRQGIDGNFGTYAYQGRVTGGEKWSSSQGKVCPGDRRIKTLLNVIIPRALVLSKPAIPKPQPPKPEPPKPQPPQEEEDMVQPFRFYKIKGKDPVWLVPVGHHIRHHIPSQAALQGHRETLYVESLVARVPAGRWSGDILEVEENSNIGKMLASIPIAG